MADAESRVRHVLLVEDDEDICKLLARYLEARQFQMHQAVDGQMAWEMFQAQPFDLVLTDVMMPRLSGLELAQRIREHPTRGNVPIMLVSAAQPDERAVSQLRIHAALRKPIPLRELLTRMEEALSLQAERRHDRLAAIQQKAAAFGRPTTNPGAFGKPVSTAGGATAPAPSFGKPVSTAGGATAPSFGKPVSTAGGATAPSFGKPVSTAGGATAPAPSFGKPVSTPGGATAPSFGKPVSTAGGATAPSFGKPVSTAGGAAAPPFGKPMSTPGGGGAAPGAAAAAPPNPGHPAGMAAQWTSAAPADRPAAAAGPAPAARADAPPPAAAFGRPVSVSGVPMAPVVLRTQQPPGPAVPLPAPTQALGAAPGANTNVAWSTQPVGAPAPLEGAMSFPALAVALVVLFERRATAVLTVEDGTHTWTIRFVDGLVVDAHTNHARGNLATHLHGLGPLPSGGTVPIMRAAAQHARQQPTAACSCVEQYAAFTRHVVASALRANGGRFWVHMWEDNPVLGTHTVLDPLDLVARTCLDELTEQDALHLLSPVREHLVFLSESIQERALVVLRQRPSLSPWTALANTPRVDQAVALLRAQGHSGARELLALALTQAVTLAAAQPPPTPARRATVLASLESPWLPPGVTAQAAQVRQHVARVWLDTWGLDAFATLGLPADASTPHVEAQAQAWRDALGPPTLDNTDLGPAKIYLALLRRRRDEALTLVVDPGHRNVYRAFLQQREARAGR